MVVEAIFVIYGSGIKHLPKIIVVWFYLQVSALVGRVIAYDILLSSMMTNNDFQIEDWPNSGWISCKSLWWRVETGIRFGDFQ